MAEKEEPSAFQVMAGGAAGSFTGMVAGYTIATGITAATGGLAAPIAPLIISACGAIGGIKGGENPKGTVYPVMAAIGKALGIWNS